MFQQLVDQGIVRVAHTHTPRSCSIVISCIIIEHNRMLSSSTDISILGGKIKVLIEFQQSRRGDMQGKRPG
jgi:hypothetical protein